MSDGSDSYDPLNGWHCAIHMLIEAMGCSRPFVLLVMQRLQSFIKQQLESRGINTEDCSTGHDFFDDGPAELLITNVAPDGVFSTDIAHSFIDDQRIDDPCCIHFKNVPPWLQSAGITEGVEM
jgi:hypothetical protein